MTERDTPARTPGPAPDATPMMVQYWEIKSQYPGHLLLFRMGDFYELFFEDAVVAAAALDIALTKRGKHQGADIPMCGVPVHALENYMARLIRQGHKLAIGEQVEDPAEAKKRGAKAVVRREVVRVVTAGTLTEDTLLDARAANHLVALAKAQNALALAWADISTGLFETAPTAAATLAADLARLEPSEVLVADRLAEDPALATALEESGAQLTVLPSARFDSTAGTRRLETAFGVAALDGFGAFERAEIAAAGALLDYVETTQQTQARQLRPPRRVEADGTVAIDAATRRSLELTETQGGARAGSLLATIDRTITGAGARLLRARLTAPLTDPAAINARLAAVAGAVALPDLCEAVRKRLTQCPDLGRALGRLGLGRGSPRDLGAVREAVRTAGEVRRMLAAQDDLPAETAEAVRDLGHFAELVDRLTRALVAEPPAAVRDGGFIAPGYHDGLDELRTLRDEGRRLIAALEARYRKDTGIAGLRIKFNNVLGYFIEVSAVQGDKLMAPPLSETFVHRQTLANQVRFNTVELGDLARRIADAGDRALALEQDLLAELIADVLGQARALDACAQGLARLDVTMALADLAATRRYARPTVDDSTAFAIVGGRHPVVEAALEGRGEAGFVANDCALGPDGRLWLLTGPNMAGKSTFLRQNALICLLAQMGSFVPAERAHIGVVDCLFSRVGAADDLARGRSTFMVEMVETAAILNQAGPRALVILDEIGRGTATFDGLSIAWATVEHLHDVNRCRALFATHYHELTALAARLDSLKCYTLAVREWQDRIVFLHEVIAGAADRSYGVQVAKLAGLPGPVIARAETVLHMLEADEAQGTVGKLADDLPLFAAMRAPTPAEPAGPTPIEAVLATLDPDTLTPREALEALYQLKELG